MEKREKQKKINTALIFILFIFSYILIFFISKIFMVSPKNIIDYNKNETISNNVVNEENANENNASNSNNGDNNLNNANNNFDNENNNGNANNNTESNNSGVTNNEQNKPGYDQGENEDNNQNQGQNPKPNPVPEPEPDKDPEPVGIKIKENGDKQWSQQEELEIFNNRYFLNTNKIAPGLAGKYNFDVQNISNKKIVYTIQFLENNSQKINLKYKLKRGEQYIIGSANEWATINNKMINETLLEKNSTQKYSLYWYWEDSENDTTIGTSQDVQYNLQINVNSAVVEE